MRTPETPSSRTGEWGGGVRPRFGNQSLAIAMELAQALSEELGHALEELRDTKEDRRALECAVGDVRELLGASSGPDMRNLVEVVRDAIAEARKGPEVPVTANEKKLSATLAGLAGSRWGRLVQLSAELGALADRFDRGAVVDVGISIRTLAAEAVKLEEAS